MTLAKIEESYIVYIAIKLHPRPSWKNVFNSSCLILKKFVWIYDFAMRSSLQFIVDGSICNQRLVYFCLYIFCCLLRTFTTWMRSIYIYVCKKSCWMFFAGDTLTMTLVRYNMVNFAKKLDTWKLVWTLILKVISNIVLKNVNIPCVQNVFSCNFWHTKVEAEGAMKFPNARTAGFIQKRSFIHQGWDLQLTLYCFTALWNVNCQTVLALVWWL